MKIILISPYLDISPVGIRILSACLKKEGHDVKLIFLPRYDNEKYEKITLKCLVNISKDADLIGISVMTGSLENVIQVTRMLKKNLDAPILWGGFHPTLRPKECLNYADMVCMGEAEKSLVELVNKMENKQNYYDVKGIWFKNKDDLVKNKLAHLPQDLDSLPFPDYDYETHYILDGKIIYKMNKNLLKKYIKGHTTLATRGCPFGCTYCCNNVINRMYSHEKILRKRSVNNIIKELIYAKNKLPVMENVTLDDDAFFLMYNSEEISDFCAKYKKNIGLPLIVTGASPATLTIEKLSSLVNAGLQFLRVGIQTGSEKTKKMYKRNYSNEKVIETVRMINKFKNKLNEVVYDIILDNPWETDKDLVETLMLLSKFPSPYILSIYSLTLYPETELYEKAKKEGIIINDLEDVYRKYYHNCRKTYLNGLFFLLKDYSRFGLRISPKKMSLLTNQKLRRFKLSWFFYIILKTYIIPFKINYLSHEFLKEIKKGNFFRIYTYIYNLKRKKLG
ncbi:MAG: radical SAM protein [Nanoarchaeota archaeon]|nr:B12-binding domain-containing radical SAM protein [Nanoarchaeota archaeon]MBU1632603.1 B12-binding domain-containing radical SAM protein [Nanoarchaeota archaeon]